MAKFLCRLIFIALSVSVLWTDCAKSNDFQLELGGVSQEEQAEAMMVVMAGPNGNKFLKARWAIGSRESIKDLYIPLAYVNPISFISCKSRLSQGGDACKAGYVVDLILDVDLSMFTSVLPISDNKQRYKSRSEFFVRSVLRGTKNLSVRQTKNIYIDVAIQMLTVGTGRNNMPVINKEAVFGLKVIGLEHGPKSDATPTYEEILYDGETPLLSDHVVLCSEGKSVGDDPKSMQHCTPQCEQYVDIESLSAVAKIRYDRDNLAHWREIDTGARAMLESFKQEGR